MNSFRADELVFMFDELKPFSDVLRDEMMLIRLHRMCKNIDNYNDDGLLRHVLCLVALMESALRADPYLIKSLQNSLIELSVLVEKAKFSASKNYVGISMGILFKYSAVLLDIQQGSNAQVAFILYSLAYHHLCSVSSKDELVSAWIAMHLLANVYYEVDRSVPWHSESHEVINISEASAAITCSDITEDQVYHLWRREDLAEYCVDTLIPSDGCIQRLHSGAYRDGIRDCRPYWPTITVKQICNLFERIQPVLHRQEILRTIIWMIGHDSTFEDMALFDNLLYTALGKSNGLDSTTITSIDVKVFLFTLSLWSDSTLHPAVVPGRLHIKIDQMNCWKAICQLIHSSPDAENVKSVLLRSRVMDSVRLRHRVVCLRRLYEVFRWLEANVDDKSWLTFYATTINDTITRVHSYRRKCDELFPDGTDTDIEFTVDEVDGIEEHVSRYLASELLDKKLFGEAERKLMYANSVESKRLLIKIYQAWLVDGHLEEHERDQLLKRVRELKAICEKNVSLDLSLSSSHPAYKLGITPPSTNRKVLVDISTNTPNRFDNSTLSSVGDENETFFSLKSDHTITSDRSLFASAIASPVGVEPHQKLLHETGSASPLVQELSVDKKKSSERQQGKSTAVDKLTKTSNLSVTAATQVVFSGNMEDLSLTGVANSDSSGYSAFSQVGTSDNTTSNSATQSGKTNGSTSIVSNGFALTSRPPFGQVINKEVATSFWKTKSAGVSIFGRSQANITASDTKNAFGQHASKNVTPTTSMLSKPAGVPCEQLPSPSSGFTDQRNNDLGAHNFPKASTPFVSQKPHFDHNLSSPVTVEENQDEDESFYNNLVLELCQRKVEGSCKKSDPDTTDMDALQKKMAIIEEQMRNTKSRLHMNTKMPSVDLSSVATTSAPTLSELRRESQHGALLELEKKVAQLMKSSPSKNMPVSRPNITVASEKPLNLVTNGVSCADPMNLFRGLLMSSNNTGDRTNLAKPVIPVGNIKTDPNALQSPSEVQVRSDISHNPLQKMEQLARHPGNPGCPCLGCMDDDAQDRALRILEQLSNDWNAICDSDSD